MADEKSSHLLQIYNDLVKGIAGENTAELMLPKMNLCLKNIDDEITEDILLDLILADEEAVNGKTDFDQDESSRTSSLFSPLTHEILEEISLDLLFDEDIFNDTVECGALSPFHFVTEFSNSITSSKTNLCLPSKSPNNEINSTSLNCSDELLENAGNFENTPSTEINSNQKDIEISIDSSINSSPKNKVEEEFLSNPEPIELLPIPPEDLAKYKRNKNPLACKICDKEFSKKANLKAHYLLHAGIKPFICEVCSKKFTRNTALVVHSLIHSGERKYVCDICDKLFARSDDLEKHKRIHTGEKPFACKICDLQFTHQNNLRRHILRHKGVKRFACKLCQEAFLDKDVLLSHLKSHLVKSVIKRNKKSCETSLIKENSIEENILKKLHKCDICGHLFNRRDRLLRHKLIHENFLSCEVCGMKFKQKDSLQSHLMTHMDFDDFSNNGSDDIVASSSNCVEPVTNGAGKKSRKKYHSCNVCFKIFSRKALLVRHNLVHTGERPHECHVCQKSFSQKITLQRHIITHTGEKSFVCNVCQKGFGRKMHLQKHQLTHSAKKLF